MNEIPKAFWNQPQTWQDFQGKVINKTKTYKNQNTCEDLNSSSRAKMMRKSGSDTREQSGDRLVILTSQLARILPEQKRCEEKLVKMQSTINKRGAVEQDGGAGKTKEIILPISLPLMHYIDTERISGQ